MIKKYHQFINESIFDDRKVISPNVIQYTVDEINDKVMAEFQDNFPNKWIIPSTSYGKNWIFVKDKPNPFTDNLPKNVYHVSPIDNLDKIGIKPSTKTESPFGYYNLTFFYLNEEMTKFGSIPYIEGKNYLYEIDTNCPVKWLEDVNKDIDEEEGIICTSDFINPDFIKKIK